MSKGSGIWTRDRQGPGIGQADTRGAEAEDLIKDKAGRVNGGLTVKAGRELKQPGPNSRELQAGSGRGQAGSSTGDQAGQRWRINLCVGSEHICRADTVGVAGMLSQSGPWWTHGTVL